MVLKRENIVIYYLYQVWDFVFFLFLVIIGVFISYEKLLLQINFEWELGSVSYKFGQVFIYFVWLGNSIIFLREEEWDEEEEEEVDVFVFLLLFMFLVNFRKYWVGVDIYFCLQFLFELYSCWILLFNLVRRILVIFISEVV